MRLYNFFQGVFMLDKFFGITFSGSTVKKEIIAGLTTFMTMSYIIFVNPDILSNSGMPRDALITATCLAAAFASILMGLYANYPIGLATSMTSNVFFAFVIVKSMGLSWQEGLAAVFIVGVLFIFITVGRIRELIMDAIPISLKMGIPAGIGIFLMFIGLQSAGNTCNLWRFPQYKYASFYIWSSAYDNTSYKKGDWCNINKHCCCNNNQHTIRAYKNA